MTGDAFQYEIKLKRGDGHDVQKCKVEAATIDELETKVDQVREKMEDWAVEWRQIQPRDRPLADDQQDFTEVGEA